MAIVLTAVLGGCRQGDGTVPVPSGEQPNRVQDLSRDLLNVAAARPEAPTELLDDLKTLDEGDEPEVEIQEVARALDEALSGKMLSEADAQALAGELFIAAAGRQLSGAQIEQLGARIKEIVVRTGATEPSAERVSLAATELATQITENRPRWYHLF